MGLSKTTLKEFATEASLACREIMKALQEAELLRMPTGKAIGPYLSGYPNDDQTTLSSEKMPLMLRRRSHNLKTNYVTSEKAAEEAPAPKT